MDDKVIPVTVAVRCRPFSKKEIEEGSSHCLEFFLQNGQININGKPFYFDHVFDINTSQDVVFELCGEPLIEKIFQGYNCTVFAYGQTGSGKTFTMGTESDETTISDANRGVIPRIVQSIFGKIDDLSSEAKVHVECSMLEIYEEKVLDLLCDKNDKDELFIREHIDKGIFVQNLSQIPVNNVTETLSRLAQGCNARTKGETAMNAKSSRSHAIFTLIIKKSMCDESGACQAKLHLVDLAGSERLKKTHAEGVRKKEGIKINEGLLALGNVISALTDMTQVRSHIPYRDSKLTRMLQDSLGGNTYTVMIACVSPADSNYEETMSSLRYAERAKKIKNKPSVNIDSDAKEIVMLRKQIEDIKRQLLEYQTGYSNENLACSSKSITSGMNSAENERLKLENDGLKTERSFLLSQMTQLTADHAGLLQKVAMAECQRDNFKEKLRHLYDYFEKNPDLIVTKKEEESLNDENIEESDLNVKTSLKKRETFRTMLFDLQKDEALCVDDDSDKDEEEEEFDEDQFRSRQKATSHQLEHLLKQIQEKENFIRESATNFEQMAQLKVDHQKEMTDLKEKIDSIQKERGDLANQLQVVNKTSKLSENRRKRMIELEKQIGDYKKKLIELQKFEKLKVQNDQALQKMREEVQGLKTQRVQLVKQLQSDNKKFKEWQMKTEKQMNQMRVKEKRREIEAVIAKRNFDQQLNVHRKKYEEAVAVSKRLQDQLQRQQSASKERFSEMQENDRLIKQVKDLLEKELELMVSAEEAKLHCENLLKQRTDLNDRLKRCDRKYQRLIKKPASQEKNSPAVRYQETENLQGEMESLRRQIDLTTSEIQELRRKADSVDNAQLESRRWFRINTLVHAKCALKQLFSIALASKVDFLQSYHQLSDVQTNFEMMAENLKEEKRENAELERKLAETERSCQETLSRANLEHSNKVSILLKELHKSGLGGQIDEGTRRAMIIHEEEARKLIQLTEQLEKKDEENFELNQALSKAKVRASATKTGASSFFRQITSKKRKSGSLDDKEDATEVVDAKLRRNQNPRRTRQLPGRFSANEVEANQIDEKPDINNLNCGDEAKVEEEEEESFTDDPNDVDYRETPEHRRHLKMGYATGVAASCESQPVRKRSKPSSSNEQQQQHTCNCKRGHCTKMLCGCTKKGLKCSAKCSCSELVCQNRNVTTGSTLSAQNDLDNETKHENVPPPTLANLDDTFLIPSINYNNPKMTSLNQVGQNLKFIDSPESPSSNKPSTSRFNNNPVSSTPIISVQNIGLGSKGRFGSPREKAGPIFFPPTIKPSGKKY